MGELTISIGEVEFIARLSKKDVTREHHESGAVQAERRTLRTLLEGKMASSKPLSVAKIGRR